MVHDVPLSAEARALLGPFVAANHFSYLPGWDEDAPARPLEYPPAFDATRMRLLT